MPSDSRLRTPSLRRRARATIGTALLAVLGALAAPAAADDETPPDRIFVNGRILTIDADFSTAEAIAVRDGRITAVGRTAVVRETAGEGTEEVDLEGRTVIPGLIDNHMHYLRGAARWRFEARIDGVTSRKNALEIIGAKAKQVGKGEWVFVLGGWGEQQFADKPGGFTREELDAAAPENPVFIQKSYSRVYMNSLATRALESGRTQGGRGRGTRSGRSSGGARDLINRALRFIPKRSAEERRDDVAHFNTAVNRVGVTAVYDVGRASDGDFSTVESLVDAKRATIRVFHSLRYSARNPADVDAAVERIGAAKPRSASDWFGLIGIGEHTYGPLHDSTMRRTEYGAEVWSQFERLATAAAAGGWQIHEHVMQDTTARGFLDVVERLEKKHRIAPLRWTLAHCDLMSKESILRAKKLGLSLAVHNKTAKPVNPDTDSPPLSWIEESGIVWGLGSDSTVVATVNPFHALWWTTTGKVFPDAPSIRKPVSREAALIAHTRSNAYLLFKESDLGTLEVGKLADLVVLDRDYMKVPVAEIRDLRPVLTVVGGEVVFRAAD